MRVRLMALVAVVLAAMVPMAGLAFTPIPPVVMSGYTTEITYDAAITNTLSFIDGSGCANLNAIDLFDALAGVVVADPKIFGFSGANPTEVHASAYYNRTFGKQRIFDVYVEAYTGPDIEGKHAFAEYEWWGPAAATCLPDGRVQFTFKGICDEYGIDYGKTEGNMGRSGRVEIIFDLTGKGAFTFKVNGPVSLTPDPVYPEPPYCSSRRPV